MLPFVVDRNSLWIGHAFFKDEKIRAAIPVDIPFEGT